MADGNKIELTQDELTQQIADAVNQSVTKLKEQNEKLLDEVKNARKLAAQYDGLDPAEVRKAVENAKQGERQALEAKGEYEKALKLATEQHEKEISKLTKQLETIGGEAKELRVSQALEAAMDEVGVAAPFRKAVLALKKSEVSVIEKDGRPAVVVGDKSVADYFKEWAGTDEGKNFVGDGGNTGGNAFGGKGSGSGQVNPWAKDTRNLTEQGKLERDNPTLASQLKQEAGVSA